MKRYKIQYNQEEQWHNYDSIAYQDRNKANEVMGDAMEQFPHNSWQIVEMER